ncbi:ABC transporter permease [Mycolicibacterium sp. A43C]
MTRPQAQPPRRGAAREVADEVWIFAGRLLVQWCRYPTVPLQALMFPAVLLLTYSVLVGKSMTRITGNSGLDLLIPVCALVGAMSGSAASGSMMSHDRENGLLTRLWIMPVRRGSALAGIVLAEALRTVLGTVLVAAIGYGLGFRFHGNIVALAGYLVIPSVIVAVYTMIVTILGLRGEGRTILAWFGTVSVGLAFAAVVPVDKTPATLRPLAEYQPVAAAVETMRLLSVGDANIGLPLAVTAVWVILLGSIFGPVAVRGYRRAAESGPVGG